MNKSSTLHTLYIPKHSRLGHSVRRAAALMAKTPGALRSMKNNVLRVLRQDIPDAAMIPLGAVSGMVLGAVLFRCYFG